MVLIYYSSFSLFYPHPFPASLYLMFSFFLFSSSFSFSPLIFTLFLPLSIIPLLIFLIFYSPFFLSPSFPTSLFLVFLLSSFPFPSCFLFSSFNSLLYSSSSIILFLMILSLSPHGLHPHPFPQLSILSAVFLPLFSSSLVSTL